MTAVPVWFALVWVVADWALAAYTVVWVICLSAKIFSLLLKVDVSKSEPEDTYCTYNKGCVVAVAALNPTTFALTPEVAPTIVTGFNAS